MISHSEFSRLRLREFCGGDDLYGDEPDEHGEFICESIRGIHFARPVSQPDDTFIIDIDLLDYSTNAGPAILAKIGIPVSRETTPDQLIRLLGSPQEILSRKPDDPPPHSDMYLFKIDGDQGYEAKFTFLEPGATADWLPCYRVASRSLWQVRIARVDLRTLFPEDTSGVEYPDPIKIEPAHIGSPECFVEQVSLLSQPTARDRIAVTIYFRLLHGMSNPRAKLLINNSTGEETTMIWLAQDHSEDGLHSIINCLDRNFLPNAFIEFSIEEEQGKVMQTYTLPLGSFRIR